VDIRSDAVREFERIGESGWYILGPAVEAFENSLAAFWRLAHCAGVGNGMDAIEIALQALGCGAGDRVLTTPLSAFATTLAIVKLGAIPVFVDVDDWGLIDLGQCEALLARRRDIRFMVPVHLYGHAVNVSAMRALGARTGVMIVEDCAQAAGAYFDGEPAGAAGACACTSFYPTKNIGALGDGGAVLTNDESLSRKAKSLRDYGQSLKYRHDLVGHNSRLDELQAGLLANVLLPRLAGWNARRAEIARRYLDGIRMPKLTISGAPPGSDSCWHLFPVLVEPARKGAFRAFLHEKGVMTGEHYPVAIPDQAALAAVPHELAFDVSRARRFCASEVSLPIHPYLSDDEIARVIAACNHWGG
jgi:dTDP-3-amino-3,4,6-trideoxy-alpha-D-glucose transaminase